jgi:P27 family predicted phage terminase small subunit
MASKKTTEALKASGSYRKDRHGGRMEAPKGKPIKPENSSESAEIWITSMMEKMGVSTPLDGMSVKMFADSWERYTSARDFIKEHGEIYTTTTAQGDLMYRKRPEVEIAHVAWQQLFAMVKQFGMTPLSRSKIESPEKEEITLEDLLS